MDAIEKRARELLAAQHRDDQRRAKAIRIAHKSVSRDDSRAVRAIVAALTPPDGWVLMPRVLTEEMLQAGHPADDAQTGYEAMIAARPEVP